MSEQEERKPRFKPIIEGAETLSLGISMVVAILIGLGIGLGLKHLFDKQWLVFVGLALGVAAALLNVFKVSSKQYKEFERLSKDPKYNVKAYLDDDDDD